MKTLSYEQITSALQDLPGWQLEAGMLVREVVFSGFADNIIVVNKIAELAEELDHHPDLDIRFNKLRIALISHDAGGITTRDVRLAKQISPLL